jgi:hypothetical protein
LIFSLRPTYGPDRPFVPLNVINPATRQLAVWYALVAPDIEAVPLPFAAAIRSGINLTTGTTGRCRGLATGSPIRVMYCSVELGLSDPRETYRWPAVVGFTADQALRVPVLGGAGGLQHFHTSLDFIHHTVTLVPRQAVPGARHTVA